MKRIAPIAAIMALALALAPGVGASAADTFPTKAITLVVGYPPGGTADILARVVGQKLSEKLKQPVIVENRPGASGMIGARHLQGLPADGYSLLVAPMTHVTNSSLYKTVPYDPLDDFTPITMLAASPLVLVVSNSFSARNVQELITATRANPGKFNCGSAGNGTSQHLACALFGAAANLDIRHVPYKGNAASLTDVMGGTIEMQFDQMATSLPQVRSGRARALGVTTTKRSPALPDVPTLAESGVTGYNAAAWFGLLAPANMPAPLVTRINTVVHDVLASPDVQKKLQDQGLELTPDSPEHFRETLKSEKDKWAQVLKQAGISAD